MTETDLLGEAEATELKEFFEDVALKGFAEWFFAKEVDEYGLPALVFYRAYFEKDVEAEAQIIQAMRANGKGQEEYEDTFRYRSPRRYRSKNRVSVYARQRRRWYQRQG